MSPLILLCMQSWRALISTFDFIAKHQGRTNYNDNNKNILIIFKRPLFPSRHFRDPPSRFPQIVDYQSLKKKNVASGVSASASATAIRSRRRDLEDEFPDDTSLNDSSLVGSCNVLICLLLDPRPSECYPKNYDNSRLLLWNPSTRKARKLPDIDSFRFGPLFHGFGYDSTTQDYKLFLGSFNYPNDPGWVAIFALKMGSWKIVEEDHIDVSLVGSRRGGCFLNGALHWNQIDGSNKGTKIWSFDFAQEKFRSFSFIRHKGYTTAVGLGTIGNRLFSYTSCDNLTNHHDLEDAGLTIWVMMIYGVDQCWTIFAKIRAEIFPSDVKWVMPICHLEDDGEVLMQSSQGDLVLYTRKMKRKKTHARLYSTILVLKKFRLCI
ncbi:F-box/kelch-repeat protein At3g06240-like [Malus domestica]|uniref:F-box/kelch-repeat protein At3g06240-like n=1 Tax=Malus domestica TaxID=3750 RepID=UPI0010AA7980|nr:F-box/kelch-repeat protein At3g06240-like [Malus domestica]